MGNFGGRIISAVWEKQSANSDVQNVLLQGDTILHNVVWTISSQVNHKDGYDKESLVIYKKSVSDKVVQRMARFYGMEVDQLYP